MEHSLLTSYAGILGRVLIGFYFFFFVFWNIYHRKEAMAFMKGEKIPLVPIALTLGIVIEGCAGLLIMFNQWTVLAAIVAIVFDIAATLMFHRFWTMKPGPIRSLNTIIFIGNFIVTIGALLMVIATS